MASQPASSPLAWLPKFHLGNQDPHVFHLPGFFVDADDGAHDGMFGIVRGIDAQGEQQRAARGGDIGVSRGGGQDQGAVGELLLAPAPERFDQVVSPTMH